MSPQIGESKRAMAITIDVIHMRVFAATRNGGNRCPVIPSADALTTAQMQGLAKRFGLDTVFVLSPRSSASDIFLRYFVPDHEMGVSGHATIAAITVGLRNQTLTGDRFRIDTRSGIFEATANRFRADIVVRLDQNRPVFGPIVAPTEVLGALRLRQRDLLTSEWPIQSVSVSRAKLVVPLVSYRALDGLRPDFDSLWRCCERLDVTGFYPFTPRTNKRGADLEARQFPLRAGFPEDAATGVAAAALGAYVTMHRDACSRGGQRFRIAQGYAMGAPSLIEALTECSGGEITGTAIRGVARLARSERILLV